MLVLMVHVTLPVFQTPENNVLLGSVCLFVCLSVCLLSLFLSLALSVCYVSYQFVLRLIV